MEKQPFKKRKGVTNTDLPSHNVKKIMNKTSPSSILHDAVLHMQGKHNCVVFKTHTRARACTQSHAYAHTDVFQESRAFKKEILF